MGRTILRLLLGLLGFGVCATLLFNIGEWGRSGHREWAIAGIIILLAVMFLLNKIPLLKTPQSAAISETANTPDVKNSKFDFLLRAAFLVCWIGAIAIGAGLFGESNPLLSGISFLLVAVGISLTILYMNHTKRKQDP